MTEPTDPPGIQAEIQEPQRVAAKPQQPNPARLMATIRRLCKERRISYMDHADEQAANRGFDAFDIYRVLDLGEIDGPILPGKNKNEWKVKVIGTLEGTSRWMGVVVIVVRDHRLLIKTVEWED